MGGRPAAASEFASLLGRFAFETARYACYPVPPRFSSTFGPREAHAALVERKAEAAPGARPAALAPRPLALSLCLPGGADPGPVIERMTREAELLVETGGAERARAVGIHGACGRSLASSEFSALMKTLGERFSLPEADRLGEVDAAEATPGALEQLSGLGFGRVRLRCRSDADEAALGPALEWSQRIVGKPVDASLEHGRAGQARASLARAIDAAARSGARCIVLNGNTSRQEPDRGQRAAAIALAIERVTAAGYENAGLDVFVPSRPTGSPFHSRYDVVGIGPGAISSRNDWYAQNHEDPRAYARAVDEGALPVARGHRLSADDRLRREVIHGLECLGTVGYSSVEYKYGIDFERYFALELARLAEFQSAGLVELYGDAVEVVPEARPVVRLVSSVFDRYLA